MKTSNGNKYEYVFVGLPDGYEIKVVFPLEQLSHLEGESEEVHAERRKMMEAVLRPFVRVISRAINNGLDEYKDFEMLEDCIKLAECRTEK